MNQYIESLRKKCESIPDTELRNMASSIDDGIGEMLFRSISENKSFDVIEMQEACKGNVIPASRNSFYRKRRRYISNIEQLPLWRVYNSHPYAGQSGNNSLISGVK